LIVCFLYSERGNFVSHMRSTNQEELVEVQQARWDKLSPRFAMDSTSPHTAGGEPIRTLRCCDPDEAVKTCAPGAFACSAVRCSAVRRNAASRRECGESAPACSNTTALLWLSSIFQRLDETMVGTKRFSNLLPRPHARFCSACPPGIHLKASKEVLEMVRREARFYLSAIGTG
jgi:hypothetical protein